MRLFFDVNVVLDVLTNREPWAADSGTALSLLESADFEGWLAAHTVTTLHYLTARHLNRERANAAMRDLLNLFHVAAVDEGALLQALTVSAPDFEDAVQAVCAIRDGADYFVTRNANDFRGLGLHVLTPSELLALLRANTQE